MNFYRLCVLLIVCTTLRSRADGDLSSWSGIQPRIFGGYNITIDQAPYMVALIKKTKLSCGGSIISNQWILTACHCVENVQPPKITIRVGSSYLSSGGKLLNISQIITHPECIVRSYKTWYDCALLKLSEKLEFDKNIQPINMPNQGDEIGVPTQCFVTGWGDTEYSDEQEQLKGVEVPIIDYQICKNQLQIEPENICAGYVEGGKDSCQGDSGGPLLCNKKIFGIVSWGIGCALPNSPGVYVNVAYIRDWIKQNSGV